MIPHVAITHTKSVGMDGEKEREKISSAAAFHFDELCEKSGHIRTSEIFGHVLCSLA